MLGLVSAWTPDTATFKSLMVVCDQLSKPYEALALMNGMLRDGVLPDVSTIRALLHVLQANLGAKATWHVMDKLFALGVKPDAKSLMALARAWETAYPDLADRLKAESIDSVFAMPPVEAMPSLAWCPFDGVA